MVAYFKELNRAPVGVTEEGYEKVLFRSTVLGTS